MNKTFLHKTLSLITALSLLTGCNIQDADGILADDTSNDPASAASTTLTPATPFTGDTYIMESSLTSVGQELADAEDDGDI